MTNEEKAKEISWNHHKEYQYEGCDGLEYFDDSVVECEASALEMADWKDQQLKEYLEKKREKFKEEINKCSFNSFTEYSIAKKMELLYEIINELFNNEK